MLVEISISLSLSDPSKYCKCSPCCPQHGSGVSGNVRSAQQGAGQNPHGPAATGIVAHISLWFDATRDKTWKVCYSHIDALTQTDPNYFQCLNCCVHVFRLPNWMKWRYVSVLCGPSLTCCCCLASSCSLKQLPHRQSCPPSHQSGRKRTLQQPRRRETYQRTLHRV